MTEKEITVLVQACKAAGIDATKIKPENPFTKNGGTASMLKAAVAEIDPSLAAKWRVEAGSSLSLSTLNEIQSGGALSDAAKNDLWNHDPVFVTETIHEREKSEAAMLRQLEENAAAAQLRNKTRELGGNEARAREVLKAEAAQAEARQQAQQEAHQQAAAMNQRIQQKQAEAARNAGVLL